MVIRLRSLTACQIASRSAARIVVLKHLIDFDAEDLGQFFDKIDRRREALVLKFAGIGAVDFGSRRKIFLRQLARGTQLSQILR